MGIVGLYSGFFAGFFGWRLSCYEPFVSLTESQHAEVANDTRPEPSPARAPTEDPPMPTAANAPEPLLAKYEAEVERLLSLKDQLTVEEGRVKWAPLGGLVLGIVVAVWSKKPLYGLLPFALSLAMVVTGFYLTRVHRMERDYNLARARREVARLKELERKRNKVSAPPA